MKPLAKSNFLDREGEVWERVHSPGDTRDVFVVVRSYDGYPCAHLVLDLTTGRRKEVQEGQQGAWELSRHATRLA